MKKFFFVLSCLTASLFVLSQGRTIYISSMLSAKPGQQKVLETAIKSHTHTFHGKDKMRVFQIMSGPNDGMYQLVQGAYTWAALDSLKLGDAHDLDFDVNIATKTQTLTGSTYSQLRPDLSHGSMDFTIEKSRVVILDIKRGRMDSAITMIKKLKDAMDKTNDKRDMTVYTKMLSGTSPQIVLIYRYKNGWTDQEDGNYQTMKNMITAAYSENDWNDWLRMGDANVEKQEAFLRVYRKDLSSL
jgi:hypothetical protein